MLKRLFSSIRGEEPQSRASSNQPARSQTVGSSSGAKRRQEDPEQLQHGHRAQTSQDEPRRHQLNNQQVVQNKRNKKGNAKSEQKNRKGGLSKSKKDYEMSQLVEETKLDLNQIKKSLGKSIGKVDGLTCSICMDYIICCRTGVCGHSFCEECINESLIRKRECPHCRKDIRKWILQGSEIIDNAVQLMVESKDAESDEEESEMKRYQERMKNHQLWKLKHQVKDVKPGEKVDVLDTEHIWCNATVELKIQAKSRQPLLYLHYEGWSRKYDEYLYMGSKRIAPLGLYTKRTDIPRYKMCNHQTALVYAHVMENARQYAQAAAQNLEQEEEEENNEEPEREALENNRRDQAPRADAQAEGDAEGEGEANSLPAGAEAAAERVQERSQPRNQSSQSQEQIESLQSQENERQETWIEGQRPSRHADNPEAMEQRRQARPPTANSTTTRRQATGSQLLPSNTSLSRLLDLGGLIEAQTFLDQPPPLISTENQNLRANPNSISASANPASAATMQQQSSLSREESRLATAGTQTTPAQSMFQAQSPQILRQQQQQQQSGENSMSSLTGNKSNGSTKK